MTRPSWRSIAAGAAVLTLASASLAAGADAAPISLVCEGQGRVTTLVRVDVGVFQEEHRQGPVHFKVMVDPDTRTVTLDGERTFRAAISETEIRFSPGRFGGGSYRIDRAAGAWRSKDGAGVCRTADLTVATGF
jgi:hypothetical protein